MEEERNYCVYMHIAPNGKKYIGITKQKPEKRWENGYGYTRQQKFYRAIQKYGWDSFKHIIIKKELSQNDALLLETYYINKFNTIENGYNVVIDGGNLGGCDNKIIVQYSLNGDICNVFNSCTTFGKIMNCDKNTINSWINQDKPVFGYVWKKYNNNEISQSIKNKIGIINYQYLNFVPNLNSYKINQYDLNGKYIRTYNSITIAQKETGINTIGNCVNNITKSAGGYMWKKYNGTINDVNPYKNNNARKILQIDNNRIINTYNSISEAAKNENLAISTIAQVCSGKKKTANGYRWKYADEDEVEI